MAEMNVDRIKLTLCAVLCVSVGINILQASRLLRLAESRAEQAILGELRQGMLVPNLLLKDLAGRRVVIDYRSMATSTVLYVFTPSCPWCERNSENLASLAKQLPRNYQLVGLSLSADGLENFVRSHAISFPVYRDLSPDTIATYRLGTTPETIVVGPGGIVSASWKGAFVGPTRPLIEKFFSVRLPDSQL